MLLNKCKDFGLVASLLQYQPEDVFFETFQNILADILKHDLEYTHFSVSWFVYLHAIVLQEVTNLLAICSIYCALIAK